MAFGRKGTSKNPGEARRPDVPDGHSHVLEHLEREEASAPQQRTQLAGKIVFDMVYRMLRTEKGTRIEDLVAILAATGGFSCAIAAIKEIVARGTDPTENEIVLGKGQDGLEYIFGDLPNRFLLEDQLSLLSLAMGAAASSGANLSLEDATSVIGRVASTAGHKEFDSPQLPQQNMPFDTPIGIVLNLFQMVANALAEYEVPYGKRPEAMGFALQQAIDAGKSALDPQMMAKIAIEYSVPAARIAPGDIKNWEAQQPR